jgi:hypothetical protein
MTLRRVGGWPDHTLTIMGAPFMTSFRHERDRTTSTTSGTHKNHATLQYHLEMPSNLKRFHTFAHDHFITFSCYKRLPYLNNDHARNIILEHVRQKHRLYIFGRVTHV